VSENIWLQFGAAGLLGLFALQVLREVLGFLRARNGGRATPLSPSAGEYAVEFWRAENYKVARQALEDFSSPLITKLSGALTEIRSDTEKLRAGQHALADTATILTGKFELLNAKLDTLLRGDSIRDP
jgi:hypothetical protein